MKFVIAELGAVMKKIAPYFALIVCFFCYTASFAATYYVSWSTGVDTYNGTSLATPFKTITKAVSVAVAGDIIYLRGEDHYYSSKVNISKNGTAANRFYLLAYPSDAARPILNFSGMAVASNNRGLDLSGSYWHVKGIDFYKAGDNGMFISGAYNIVEFCAFYENADTGLQLANSANNNQIINCDSYYNIDPAEGNADGFAAKLDVGTGNSFRGCRAWQNSDDGWDGLLSTGLGTNPVTTYDSNWCFLNGYRKDMTASTGNGNGFKMGGNNERHDVIMRNCLAVYNRVKGFDQNNNNGTMILLNCTGFRNGRNFGMANNAPSSGEVMEIKNSISYLGVNSDQFHSSAVRVTNSWQLSSFTISAGDFVSLDTSVLRAPRNADGSLPNINLLKLAQGSRMIDAGTDVGLPYNGSKPDLGYAESNYPFPVELISFSAVNKNGAIELIWKTSSESNNKGWDMERFIPGTIAWQKIGFLEGKGNSATANSYSFIDRNTIVGNTVQYRLKQIDNDGSTRYSNIVIVKLTNEKAELTAFPNPVKNITVVRFNTSTSSRIKLDLYNNKGQLVQQIANEIFTAGSHSLQVNTSTFPAGQYYLKLIEGGTVHSYSLLKLE